MWNKGLSYRERHGLRNVGINKITNTKTGDTLNPDKIVSNHSLGLVFSLPLTGRFQKRILSDKNDYSIREIKL